jgi:tetratricopeptide (TPR) repeat protein
MSLKKSNANDDQSGHSLNNAKELFVALITRCEQTTDAHNKDPWESSLAEMGLRIGLSDQDMFELADLYPRCLGEIRRYFKIKSQKDQAIHYDLTEDQAPRAIAQYLNYIATKPYDQSARLLCSRLLIMRGEFAAAESLYNRGLEYGEDHSLLALRAELLLSQGQFKEAYILSLKAINQSSNDPELQITYVQCCQWVGQEKEARERLQSLVKQYPDHVLIQARLLECDDPYLCPTDLLKRAEEGYAQHLHRHFHQALIVNLLRAHKYERAYEESKLLMQKVGKNIEVEIMMVISEMYMAHLDQAYTRCESLRAKHPNSVRVASLYLMILTMKGTAHHLLQPLFNALLPYGNESPLVSQWCTNLLDLWHQTEEAHELRQKRQLQHPTHLKSKLDYIRSLITLQRFEEAKPLIDEALNDESCALEFWLLCADIALHEADHTKVEYCLSHCPNHPKMNEIKLRLLIQCKEFLAARDLATTLVQRNPSKSYLIEYLVNMLWQTEEEITPELLALYESLPSATRQQPLLILFAYLFVRLECSGLATDICDEVLSRGALLGFSEKRYLFACEVAHTLKHKQALKSWSEEALADFPKTPELKFYSAMSLWYQGSYLKSFELGLESYEALQEKCPAEYTLIMSIWACELGLYDQAYSLTEALAQHPDHDGSELEALRVRVWLNVDERFIFDQGVSLAENWVKHDDIERLEFAIDWVLESVSIMVHHKQVSAQDDQRSLTISDIERTELALKWSLNGVIEVPSSSSLWRKLSICYQYLGNIPAAIHGLETVIKNSNKLSIDYLILSQLYEQDQCYGQARIALNLGLQLVESSDRSTYLLEYACLLLRQGDLLNARKFFEELIELVTSKKVDNIGDEGSGLQAIEMSKSDLLSLWLSHGLQYLSAGEAHTLAERLVIQYPEPITEVFVGLTQLALGRYGDALPRLEEGYRIEGLFGGDYSACLWSLGQRDQAINILLECLEASPHEVDLYYQVVLYLIEASRNDEAYAFYLDLITLAPDYEEREALDNMMHTLMIRH